MTAGTTATPPDKFAILEKIVRRRRVEDRRRIERARRSTTCRCLFGKPDQTELARLVREFNLSEREKCIKKYSFDVWLGKPMDENIQIENKIENETDNPLQKSMELPLERTPQKRRPAQEAMELEFCEEDKENVDCGRRSASRSPRSAKKRSPKSKKWCGLESRPRQLQMTDFWRQRKHSEASNSDRE